MSLVSIWDTEFGIVKFNAAGQAGPAYAYVKPPRRATVSAATQAGILAVLQADIPVCPGETIEILIVRPGTTVGTEGSAVLS